MQKGPSLPLLLWCTTNSWRRQHFLCGECTVVLPFLFLPCSVSSSHGLQISSVFSANLQEEETTKGNLHTAGFFLSHPPQPSLLFCEPKMALPRSLTPTAAQRKGRRKKKEKHLPNKRKTLLLPPPKVCPLHVQRNKDGGETSSFLPSWVLNAGDHHLLRKVCAFAALL